MSRKQGPHRQMGMRPTAIAADRLHQDLWSGENISEAVEA
jgi:hypothetical protein